MLDKLAVYIVREKLHSLLRKNLALFHGSEALLSFREKTDLMEVSKAVISRLRV